MTDHAWLVNVYHDLPQALALLRVLRRYYSENSSAVVHLSGRGYAPAELEELSRLADVIRGEYQPDKCLGIITALNALVARAAELGASVASPLHPDMVPLCRPAWRAFLRRFAGGKWPLACAPMWPGHAGVSFCSLHFRLPEATALFPIRTFRRPGLAFDGWFNEMQAALYWDAVMPGWRGRAYPLLQFTMPYTAQHWDGNDEPVQKVMHSHRGSWVWHDYCPETSIIHADDADFWRDYEALARF